MKNAASVAQPAVAHTEGADRRTRDRVIERLAAGGATAAQLGTALGLKPAAIRRHLDALLNDGLVTCRDLRSRGRGRPSKLFTLTAAAREGIGGHTYDDLAAAALRWIAASGGEAAVSAFARAQVADLEARCETALREAGGDPLARAEALANALTAEGYAANASVIASGGQLCQHHCPVAHVAAEFPQLCEAETQVISRLVGTHVQRLATIAHGDGVCTTHIPSRQAGEHELGPGRQGERQLSPGRQVGEHEFGPGLRAGDQHVPLGRAAGDQIAANTPGPL